MKKITVLLAEDHTIVREGFRKMLELEDDLEVIGEAQNGRQAVTMVRKLRPDVVLMDIAMPMLNGLEATRQILKAVPAAKVLMLSAHSDDAYVKNADESGAMEGKANKETAAELGIGMKTVEKHREHLMQKLDIHDTAGLTRYAISTGIIESSVHLTII
jgi:DNA-binding NarL/FixJ family response regulator